MSLNVTVSIRPVASTFEVVQPRNVDLKIDNLRILGGRYRPLSVGGGSGGMPPQKILRF